MWTVLVPPVFYTAVPWVLAYGQLGVQLPDCIRNVLWQPPVKGNGTDITDDEIADFQPGATGCVYCLYRSIFLDWTYEHRGFGITTMSHQRYLSPPCPPAGSELLKNT